MTWQKDSIPAWERTIRDIRNRMNDLAPQIGRLNEQLSRAVLQYEHLNTLVYETNLQILDRLKVLTNGTLTESAAQPLSHWGDAAITADITRAEALAQQAATELATFTQVRSQPDIAKMITAVHSGTTVALNSLETLPNQIPDGANNPEYKMLHEQIVAQSQTIDKYSNDLRAPYRPPTPTMTVTELAAATNVRSLAGKSDDLNHGDPTRGRLRGHQRVDVPQPPEEPRNPREGGEDGLETQGGSGDPRPVEITPPPVEGEGMAG